LGGGGKEKESPLLSTRGKERGRKASSFKIVAKKLKGKSLPKEKGEGKRKGSC